MKMSVSILIDLYPEFGGPWDMLGIFFVNVIFIMLQKKSFGQNFFEFHAQVQKCHFARIEKLPKYTYSHFTAAVLPLTQFFAPLYVSGEMS